MKTVCLVSCSSRKQSGRHPARDLYMSDLFSKSAKYAEHNADEWYILSAKFGLLKPHEIIERYDVALNRLPAAARREWAVRVFHTLKQVVSPLDLVVVLAGERYAEHLVPMLRAHGVEVLRPLEGMRIGQQLTWLKEQTG